MDPDAALCKMREALACAKDRLEVAGFDDDEYIGYLECVAECAEALDGWLSNGGFLPKRWILAAPKDYAEADRVADQVLGDPLAPEERTVAEDNGVAFLDDHRRLESPLNP